MSYASTLQYIHRVEWRGQKPGLSRISALLEQLGHPEQKLRFVHIGGTNGKGSTAAMVDQVLRTAGYHVGLYTSPYLYRFNERIRVDGAEITDAELEETVNDLRPFADHMEDLPSEFELITAAALLYFARKQCDLVVLEVGLGGEFDATNAIPCPDLAVFTPISLDHTAVLGPTIQAIAQTKAGIIKEGGDVVSAPQLPEAADILREVCAARHARLSFVDSDRLELGPASLEGRVFRYGDLGEVHLPLLARYQPSNAATAITALEQLIKKGWHISRRDILEGLGQVQWPGRLEVLSRDPVFLLDGSHNPQGIGATAESLQELFPGRQFVFLLSIMADKDVDAMLPELLPLGKAFFTVTADNPRALPASALAEKLQALGAPAIPCPTVAAGVAAARAAGGRENPVCALGTLYFSGEVRRALELEN